LNDADILRGRTQQRFAIVDQHIADNVTVMASSG